SVEAVARSAAQRTHAFIVLHRLDNLRRSGRIGTAASWLGTALSLKPLLRLDVDGHLVLDQRIRTITKAHAAMVDRIAELVGQRQAS
ncbi:DegV family protein, partial [Escherichia coli]|nr:DegV family protein [Escherichia coli]